MMPAPLRGTRLGRVTTSSSAARPAGLGAWAAANPNLVDAFIAFGLTALSLLTLAGGAQDLGSIDPLSLFLLVLQTLPLIVRRRWPLTVFIITAAATTLHAALATDPISSSLGFLVALFTLAEQRDRRTSGLATLVAAVVVGGLLI